MNMLDTIDTPEGKALVVGFPTHDQVEVRLQGQDELRIFNVEDVIDPEAAKDLEAFKEAGRNPTVLDNAPRGKDGRKLAGVALRNALARQEREK